MLYVLSSSACSQVNSMREVDKVIMRVEHLFFDALAHPRVWIVLMPAISARLANRVDGRDVDRNSSRIIGPQLSDLIKELVKRHC